MTGQEILEQAARYNGFSIDEGDALAYINEALARLGEMGYVFGVIEVEAERNVSYLLPQNAINIVRVEDKDSRRAYYGYRKVGDEIIFLKDGEYVIYARKMPEPLDFIDEEPDVPPLYHPAIVMYVRGMTKLQDDEMNPDGHRLIQKFEEEAARAYQMLMRERVPVSIKVER